MTTELMNNLRRQFLDKVNQCFSSDSEKHADAEQLLESQISEDEVKLASRMIICQHLTGAPVG